VRSRILFGAALVVALLGTTGIASAAPSGLPSYTCTAAHIPSGTYASITVTGACDVVPDAVITVVGNLNVAAGAIFDAQSAPSTITVGHNVTAAAGAFIGLGCLPNPPGHTTGHPCSVEPDGSSNITVNGNLSATNADTVFLNGITVNGNVTLTGGGGAIPWPIKMNTIGGNLIVSNMTPNWLGVIRNNIGGNAILTNVTITDALFGDPTPTIFVASNTVGHNLICSGLGPAVSGGFPGEVNVVGHKAIGQCANLPDFIPGS
jgi:hypothetical protein